MPSDCQFALRLARSGFALEADATFPGTGLTGVFGPSGSGKTTLLRCLAGLEPGVRGQIDIRGKVWLDTASAVVVPAEERRVGFVFQDERLFPHLEVAGKLEFARRPAAAPAGTSPTRP